MTVRSTMSNLLARVRLMIADPSGVNQQFSDQALQDKLDFHRMDVRYLPLALAPSIVNTASTNNLPSVIFADYYADFGDWEEDVILQGNDDNNNAWKVLTPVASDYIVGHFQFQLTPFVNGTVPGRLPPLWITGKSYDLYHTSADLLEFWAATLACAYDITVDGQSLRRSQMMQNKLTLAQMYRRQARPKRVRMVRNDVMPALSSRRIRLLDDEDHWKGVV